MAATGWMSGGGAGGLSPMRGRVADLGQSVASYPTYEQAQRAMDYLSDQGFPVESTAIVGENLSLVEKVLGRMTTAKAALSGAMSGGWFGLFIGLMFGIFTTRNWAAVVFTGLAIGALWGAIFGAIAHAATRGQRDFASRSALAAGTFSIKTDPATAARAASMLASLPAAGAPVGAGMPGGMNTRMGTPGGAPPSGTMPPGTMQPPTGMPPGTIQPPTGMPPGTMPPGTMQPPTGMPPGTIQPPTGMPPEPDGTMRPPQPGA